MIDRSWIARLGRAALLASLLAGPVAATTVAQPRPIDGAPTSGDPYFPNEGNGGYDVAHYDLDLTVNPKRRTIRGVATIDLVPDAALRSFTLDLAGYTVSSVTVDGARAAFSRPNRKVRVTPAQPLDAGVPATVQIRWSGKPVTKQRTGWLWFEDGGALVSTQTNGASTLFPANDHPSDKASVAVSVAVPKRSRAVANGLPEGSPSRRRFAWREDEPMPTNAVVVAVGRLSVRQSAGPDGLPIVDAYPRQHAKRLTRRFARQGQIIRVLEQYFGPYPYSAAGVVVLPMNGLDPIEAAGRPSFPDLDYALKDRELGQMLAHEIAHQWAGNSVTPATWKDIWLSEGFATYGELLWIAEDRGVPIGSLFARNSDVFLYAPAMNRPPGDPGRNDPFNLTVYNRGALTLEALRRTVGDDDFYEILRTWMTENRNQNVSTADFIALAERISGDDLDALFERWLYTPGLPNLPPG